MKFGEKLKQGRLRADMTQEAVARRIGVSRQSLSNWENDRTYPDLASVIKLSDLYGISLDELLREDLELRRQMERRQEKVKTYSSWLHDVAMLMIASNLLLSWLDKTGLGIALGVIGLALIGVAHFLFVRFLGADRKTMALRSLGMAMWFAGFMMRINLGHLDGPANLLWFGGMGVICYVGYRMRFEVRYYQHMTAFTGFVMALVILFGAIPFVGDSLEKGDYVEGNPFNSRDYRVAKVLAGEAAPLPKVYLGSNTSVYLWFPDREERLEGSFTYITQPEGAKTRGIWEMIPEGEENLLYRVAVGENDSVTMTCLNQDQVQWAYLLEPSPTAGCTIRDVLGTVTGAVDWYYAGSFDAGAAPGGFPLRGKGTVKLSVPGTEETVTIYEEFRDGNTVENRTMVLTKDARGFVEFKRETRQDGGPQTGIYRIPYQEGEFVLVLNFVK